MFVQGDSVMMFGKVYVFPCLIGDSLLDDPIIRQGLRDAWAGSNPDGNANDRTERYGGKACTNGVCSPVLGPIGANDNACRNFPSDPSGSWTVTWHTHPFMPGDTLDPLPSDSTKCAWPRDTNGNPFQPPSPRKSAPRPSREDRVTNSWLPRIVIDKQNVYFLPANDTLTVKTFDRNTCDPLAGAIY